MTTMKDMLRRPLAGLATLAMLGVAPVASVALPTAADLLRLVDERIGDQRAEIGLDRPHALAAATGRAAGGGGGGGGGTSASASTLFGWRNPVSPHLAVEMEVHLS